MKWAYTLKNKITASVLLLFVLGLVFINNLSERNNAEQLNTLIHSIYSDRLIVENYIFGISENMHTIIELSNSTDLNEQAKKSKINAAVNRIKLLTNSYSKTLLTEKEDSVFKEFSGLSHSLYLNAMNDRVDECGKIAEQSLALLDTLSSIQVAEATAIVTKTKDIFSSGKAYSQFEMALLVLIALVVQAFIFMSPGLHKVVGQPYRFN